MDNNKWTSFIEELKSRNDIVDVIGSYTNVIHKGRSYWANCPFHHEKTPSFSISKEGQFYHCFGCSVSGDVIKFVQDYDNCSFIEAVETLAKRVGMQVPSSDSVDDIKRQKMLEEKQKLYDVCLFAAKQYNTNLKSKYGDRAQEYLTKRGISSDTVSKFGLGLSLNYDQLPMQLGKNGFDLAVASKAGIIYYNNNGKPVDCLAERLIIPIIDSTNRVIAFGGRTLKNGDFAKYKNTSGTPIFDKSKTLFNVNLVKKAKQEKKIEEVIMVEGYMDTIALVQAGISNVVASMGTSLTPEQAKALKRLADVVYICYDGDSAGQNATLRGLDILASQGLEVKVMSLPDKLDPDEVILKGGIEAFNKLMAQALPLTDYKLLILSKQFDIKSDKIVVRQEAIRKFTQEALKIINDLPTAVEKESYINNLCKMTGFSMDFLKSQLTNKQINITELPQLNIKDIDKATYFVVSSMLYGKNFVTEVEIVSSDYVIETALKYIKDCGQQGKQVNPSMMYQLVSDEQFADKVNYLLDARFSSTLEDGKYYNDCVNKIKQQNILRQIDELNKQYETALNKAEVLQQIQQLNKLLKK